MDFSDSEEVDSVCEEESDVSSDEGPGVPKGAVAQLLSLKRVRLLLFLLNTIHISSFNGC